MRLERWLLIAEHDKVFTQHEYGCYAHQVNLFLIANYCLLAFSSHAACLIRSHNNLNESQNAKLRNGSSAHVMVRNTTV